MFMRKSGFARSAMFPLVVAATMYADTAMSQAALEEVFVTAERKSASLQDVPIVVNVFDNEALARAGVVRTDDLTLVTPGLQVSNSLGNALVFMRGVGTFNATAGAEAGVAFYVDDVYYAEAAGVMTSLANIERVEVLKGPQGTLYGRNATGGLIHMITPDPQDEGLVRLKVGYADYDTSAGALYATGGVTEHLKASLSATAQYQGDGYGNNVTRKEDANYVRNQGARVKLLWEPTEADRIIFASSYYHDTSDLGVVTTILKGTTTLTGGTYPGSIYNTSVNTDTDNEVKAWDTSLKWEHTLDNGMVFKSISAYREVDAKTDRFDVDQSSVDYLEADIRKKNWSFQQEFLLQGGMDRLEYTAGLFYFTNSTKFPVLTRTVGLNDDSYPKNTVDSYSIFGQADYHFTDRDTVTLGLRYTLDDQSIESRHVVNDFLVSEDEGSEDFDKVTWRLALKHEFTDDLMAYASASRGFRSGLFNSLSPADSPVKPETLDAYEIGVKGDFLDRHLQLGANAFYYDYADMQVATFEGITSQLSNAGKAEMYGVEVDGQAAVPVPVGDLRLNAILGVMHAEYTQYKECDAFVPNDTFPYGNTEAKIDCSGNEVMYTPDWELTLGANYTVPVGHSGAELGFGLTYYHSDGMFYEPANVYEQDAYDWLNADVSYTFPEGHSRLRLYCWNLTDEKVKSVVQANYILETHSLPKPPRVVGVEFEYLWE